MKKYLQTLQERKMNESDEGFTLIELLIVIVVLGILAAVVVFALGSVTGNAKAAACNSDAKTVVTAVQAYNAQNSPNSIAKETYAAGPPIVYGTTQQALLISAGYLNAWPSTNNTYVLRLAGTNDAGANAGDVMVNANGAGWIDYNAQTSTNGCNAL